jgi:hypothetical protein
MMLDVVDGRMAMMHDMDVDVDMDALLRRWQVASAALMDAECRDPYSDEVDDLADEVLAARLALTQAGVRDIAALAEGRDKLAQPADMVIGF